MCAGLVAPLFYPEDGAAEDGAAEAPTARGHPELSQLSTTKSHASGQHLFAFDSESRAICPFFQKMIKLCAAEAEAHWALLCDGMWLLKGLRLLGLPFDASKEQQTEQRVMKQQHNTLGSLQQSMEAAAEKKIREEKNVNKVEKTKDMELEELRAENAKLKSGELTSLRALLSKEDAETWKKQQRRRGGGKGPDNTYRDAASSSGTQQQQQQQQQGGKFNTGKDSGKSGKSSAGKSSNKKGKGPRGGR